MCTTYFLLYGELVTQHDVATKIKVIYNEKDTQKTNKYVLVQILLKIDIEPNCIYMYSHALKGENSASSDSREFFYY